MGVKVSRITCLSYDKGDEKYDKRKVFVGDIVSLLMYSGGIYYGVIEKIQNSTITIRQMDNHAKDVVINIDSIKAFDIYQRGTVCRTICR